MPHRNNNTTTILAKSSSHSLSSSSTSSVTPSSAAVLVTAPHCHDESGGVIRVVPEQYETVTIPGPNKSRLGGSSLMGSLWGMLSTDSSSQQQAVHELEDMGTSSSSPLSRTPFRGGSPRRIRTTDDSSVVKISPQREAYQGDFDACREYSYTMDDDEDDDKNDTTNPPSLIPMPNPMLRGHNNSNSISYVLGKVYRPDQTFTARRDDEASLFWFTYRSHFPEIAPYGITSDAGWGCMLRSAQMLLGHALRLHYKSRHWRSPHLLTQRRQDPFIRSLLTWFADFPSATQCFYSLHNMVAAGLQYDKLPGEWYGPGGVCYVLRDLVELHAKYQQSLVVGTTTAANVKPVFRVHVAQEGTVYRDALRNLMTRDSKARLDAQVAKKHQRNPQAHPLDLDWEEDLVEAVGHVDWDTSLLLMIPTRLGLDHFNERYVEAVAHTFSLPQSVGVLGGRIRGARWFYGAVADGSQVFGLDPHTVQTAPRHRTARINGKLTSTVDISDDYLRSCHTNYPEILSLQRMDPSIALGFYCRDQADLENLLAAMDRWQRQHPDSPTLFDVADSAPQYNTTSTSEMMESSMLESNGGGGGSGDNGSDGDSADGGGDDYVLL